MRETKTPKGLWFYFQADPHLRFLLEDRPPQSTLVYRRESSSSELGDSERDQLKDFPRLEYLFDKRELQCAALGLVDLLFAAALDCIITEGEGNCESAWSIAKVSASISAFEVSVFCMVREINEIGEKKCCLCF